MVYSGQFYISMPGFSSFPHTAFYLSRVQYILAYLLITNQARPMWEKGGNIYALHRSIQRTYHVYFQRLLQDRHTLCGNQRMAWQEQAAKRNIPWIALWNDCPGDQWRARSRGRGFTALQQENPTRPAVSRTGNGKIFYISFTSLSYMGKPT